MFKRIQSILRKNSTPTSTTTEPVESPVSDMRFNTVKNEIDSSMVNTRNRFKNLGRTILGKQDPAQPIIQNLSPSAPVNEPAKETVITAPVTPVEPVAPIVKVETVSPAPISSAPKPISTTQAAPVVKINPPTPKPVVKTTQPAPFVFTKEMRADMMKQWLDKGGLSGNRKKS